MNAEPNTDPNRQALAGFVADLEKTGLPPVALIAICMNAAVLFAAKAPNRIGRGHFINGLTEEFRGRLQQYLPRAAGGLFKSNRPALVVPGGARLASLPTRTSLSRPSTGDAPAGDVVAIAALGDSHPVRASGDAD